MGSERTPWHPDPRLADPLIALLGTLALLLAWLGMLSQRVAAQAASSADPLQEALKRLPPGPGVALLGYGIQALFWGGLAFALLLLAQRKEPRPPTPAWGMSGRAVALVFLGWFIGYVVLSTLVGSALARLNSGRALSVPLGYALHASLGAWMLMRAEGLSFQELRARVMPGPAGRQWAWTPAFLALAVFAVMAAALLSAPLLRHQGNPQAQLQDLLRSAKGFWMPMLLLFTVSVLAPLFEELMFRGFLLPWLGARWGWGRGLLVSSLLFGFIHLQPAGLPTLMALGFALGLALWRTGSLRASVLVHAIWNGSLFMLLRAAG